MASEHRIVARNTKQQRTLEEFGSASSLHPLVVGHMCKQDKTGHSFSKRYFALYSGGLLAYYTHQRDYEGDVKKNKGLVSMSILLKPITNCLYNYYIPLFSSCSASSLYTDKIGRSLSH